MAREILTANLAETRELIDGLREPPREPAAKRSLTADGRARRGSLQRSPPAVGGQPGMRMSTGRTTFDRSDELTALPEDVAAERAVAERSHQAWLGMASYARLSGSTSRGRHGAGDQQHVGVTRRGDEREAEARKIVVRVRNVLELVLAAIARSGVDVTERERRSARGVPWRLSALISCELLQQARTSSAVHAGVAELEALVDRAGSRGAGCRPRGRNAASSRTTTFAAAAADVPGRRARRCRSRRRERSRRSRLRSARTKLRAP